MSTLINCLFTIILLFPGRPERIEPTADGAIKIFRIDNKEIRVTCEVEEVFYGLYKGAKSGYLLINRDGTGEYKYDIIGTASPGCREGVINFEWGCPVNRDNEKVKFKKHYGYSYPFIFKCSGDICFQGCSKKYILDFILDKQDGKLHVSSSDDWKKAK